MSELFMAEGLSIIRCSKTLEVHDKAELIVITTSDD
jgi:hypothetical protein